MQAPRLGLFTGITSRRWTGFFLIWLLIAILFSFLYATARDAVMSEIRAHVMGVAIATSAGLDPDDIESIRSPDDMESEAFRRVQSLLDRVSTVNKDIRYVYTMRKSTAEDAASSDYLYVVDQPARDESGNGIIDEDEISEAPGNTYDASPFPAMIPAWQTPTADKEITPDPPYPDLISGYAPLRNARGQTVAIVGVDMIAPTVRHKILGIRAVNLVVGVVLALLVTLVVQLYYHQREAFERIKLLSEELASRNEMLRAANDQLARHNEQYQQELRLAEQVQQGFLPRTFPRQDRLVFDKFYLACDILGGDLFDVFSDEQDHVALYVADVAGHGVSAALISGLLKMAVASIRERGGFARGHLRADLMHPSAVLGTLNEMLVKEIPEYEFITVLYAVLDLSSDTFLLSSAGHPPPVYFDAGRGEASAWQVPTGMALGFAAEQEYPSVERKVNEGDKVLFYTDGLIEAMDAAGEEFGIARVIETVRQHGHLEAQEIISALRRAVTAHCGDQELTDDFSLLVTHLR